ncbi:GNAT family N-acetyltransferase [Clostridium boliviensis]|uniref:GNAT family N-acetyltransferase n=1 Tax=Clostridium boliviensis TaxID=318465 RepID=A0ABU4GLE9_9CLOT|nr:GNAT family N-acetyltransferase [Clostridium boliviensis]MDW2798453.1 GNAT family N-acetyltransferase [Clostridium boliviensis]
MNISYKRAIKEDADLLIQIYNGAFYDDYVRYGECPAYGRSREGMEKSMENFPKDIIYCDDIPAGVISVEDMGKGEYYLGCLCIIPQYQGKGIGTQALEFVLDKYSDWKKITLITPSDKKENINFYTKKFAFKIDGTQMEGNVQLAHFVMVR